MILNTLLNKYQTEIENGISYYRSIQGSESAQKDGMSYLQINEKIIYLFGALEAIKLLREKLHKTIIGRIL